ncbi:MULTISPECIES: hypothetical protein [unclassified Streptomyces]|uniref:hypothetical protein n=1 Tax=unclassified Streptomyces TaxID=2593676 RepID=UPI002259513C|nr:MULTISPECIES: hypothetical protein [unclassified Streptomyces]MCX5141932.1 hypothetical protein [Streptomyces sp. NBC_00338]WRZ66406.1 hypothetical protein OG408_22140 [Streptomyces sp. NBC_01257]WSU60400.1 hypothetical protein OG450_22305 [Streptomyces sp. NBC_01104]
MTDKRYSKSSVAHVRPWHSLASLGLIESDLTHTRTLSAPAVHERFGHRASERRTARPEEA